MSPKDTRIQALVTKIRSTAESLRGGKQELAESFIVGAEECLKTYGKSLDPVAAIIRMYQSGVTAASHVLTNPTVRTMSQRLVANIADDVASRMNEAATLLEAASKEPTVIEALAAVEQAAKEFDEAMRRLKSSKPKFTVVQHPEPTLADDQDTTKPSSMN